MRLSPSRARRRRGARRFQAQADEVIQQRRADDQQSEFAVPRGVKVKARRQQPPDANLLAGERPRVSARPGESQAQATPGHEPVHGEHESEELRECPRTEQHGTSLGPGRSGDRGAMRNLPRKGADARCGVKCNQTCEAINPKNVPAACGLAAPREPRQQHLSPEAERVGNGGRRSHVRQIVKPVVVYPVARIDDGDLIVVTQAG